MGFHDRTRTFSHLKDGTYKYGTVSDKAQLHPDNRAGYSIILPPIFLHQAYLDMMFDSVMVDRELIDYIDTIMNCDDILMSVMVTKFLHDGGWPQSGGLQLRVKSLRSVARLSKLFVGH